MGWVIVLDNFQPFIWGCRISELLHSYSREHTALISEHFYRHLRMILHKGNALVYIVMMSTLLMLPSDNGPTCTLVTSSYKISTLLLCCWHNWSYLPDYMVFYHYCDNELVTIVYINKFTSIDRSLPPTRSAQSSPAAVIIPTIWQATGHSAPLSSWYCPYPL